MDREFQKLIDALRQTEEDAARIEDIAATIEDLEVKCDRLKSEIEEFKAAVASSSIEIPLAA